MISDIQSFLSFGCVSEVSTTAASGLTRPSNWAINLAVGWNRSLLRREYAAYNPKCQGSNYAATND